MRAAGVLLAVALILVGMNRTVVNLVLTTAEAIARHLVHADFMGPIMLPRLIGTPTRP